jgi:DNA-binding Lrp family transcriptional regulator
MSQRAFVLIEAQVGKSRGIVEALQGAPEVEEAHIIMGPYSVIAILNGKDPDDVARIVAERLHKAPGVLRTISCLGLDGEQAAMA